MVLGAVLATTLALPRAQARGPKTPRWRSVTITVTCDDKEPALCRGQYGFTVNVDGSFSVGPPPDGEAVTDNLSADELALIAKNAEALSRTSKRAKARCDKGPPPPGAHPTVVLTKADGSTVTVFQGAIAGKGSRCTIGKRETAVELETSLGLLMALHYPLPFPS